MNEPKMDEVKDTNNNAKIVEIPFWVNGKQKWISGLSERTTCVSVVKALLRAEGKTRALAQGDLMRFSIIEKWRDVERPLGAETKIVSVWQSWGEEASEVKFTLKKQQSTRDKQKKGKIISAKNKTQHRGEAEKPSSNSATLGVEDALTASMEKLVKIILAQGETIQLQLQRLQEKQDQIESMEVMKHMMRVKESGRDYLLNTYLQQLPDAEPEQKSQRTCTRTGEREEVVGDKREKDDFVVSNTFCRVRNSLRKSRDKRRPTKKSSSQADDVLNPEQKYGDDVLGQTVGENDVRAWVDITEKLHSVNRELEMKEEECLRLQARVRKHGRTLERNHRSEDLQQVDGAEELMKAQIQETRNSIDNYDRSSKSLELLLEDNQRTIESMQKELQSKGELLQQLEYDYQIRNTEGNRLERELKWVLKLPLGVFTDEGSRLPEHAESRLSPAPATAATVAEENLSDEELELERELSRVRVLMASQGRQGDGALPGKADVATATATPDVLATFEDDSCCIARASSTSSSASSGNYSAGSSLAGAVVQEEAVYANLPPLPAMMEPLSQSTPKESVRDNDNNSDTGLSSLHSSGDETNFSDEFLKMPRSNEMLKPEIVRISRCEDLGTLV